MKARRYLSILLVVLFVVATATTALAGNQTSVILNQQNELRVRVNGEYIEFTDTQPVMVQSRVLVPLRGVFEAMGFTVDWDRDTSTGTLSSDSDIITVTIGDPAITVNGVRQYPEVPPQIRAGSFFVPLRVVGEATGAEVLWVPHTTTAIINTAPAQTVTPTPTPLPPASPTPTPEPPAHDFTELSPYFDGRAFTTIHYELSDGTILYVSYTLVVRRNEDVIVRFDGRPGDVYNLRVRYASGYGTAEGLGESTVNEHGFVSWRWRVGGRTAFGDFPITITGRGETIQLLLSIVE